MSTYKNIDNKQINVSLCRDPTRIVEILHRDYFDEPICYFSRSLLRVFAQWISKSNRMFLVTLDVDGNYAGFIFGHTMGQKSIWKRFALANSRHFFALFLVWMHMNVFPWVRIHILKKTKTLNKENLAKLNNLNLPTLNHPFSWSPDDPQVGCTEMSFVAPEFRGLGLSNYLSKYLYYEMSKRGVQFVEAHINADNYPAVRATLNHGFEIFKMGTGDFYARRNLTNENSYDYSSAEQTTNYKSGTISLVSSPEQWSLPELRQTWEKLLDSSDNLDLLYQSPQWFEHLFATNTNNTRLLLGVAKNNTGCLAGIVPIRIDRYSLKFDISSYTFWKTTLSTAFILGSQPLLLTNEERLYDNFFSAIWQNIPECTHSSFFY